MQKKVLLFGGSGMVGSHLLSNLKKSFLVEAPRSDAVDIKKKNDIQKFINKLMPDIIVNSAGFAKMEECERNPDLANQLNATASENIVECLYGKKIPYYYISTGAVFDGVNIRTPFLESQTKNPISVYAATKAKGEDFTLSYAYGSVLRISFPYTDEFRGKNDMVRDMASSLKVNHEYTGITDQMINPLSLFDIAKGIYTIINSNKLGIYHVAANSSVSNYEFLCKAAKLLSLNEKKINKIKLENFMDGKKAYRANYCVLGVDRFNKEFYRLATVQESLENFVAQFAF